MKKHRNTLAFFDSQEVDLKVISGDDPVTVAAIARRAGLKNADSYVDATTLTTEEECTGCSGTVQRVRTCDTTAEESNGPGIAVSGAYSCDDR